MKIIYLINIILNKQTYARILDYNADGKINLQDIE